MWGEEYITFSSPFTFIVKTFKIKNTRTDSIEICLKITIFGICYKIKSRIKRNHMFKRCLKKAPNTFVPTQYRKHKKTMTTYKAVSKHIKPGQRVPKSLDASLLSASHCEQAFRLTAGEIYF